MGCSLGCQSGMWTQDSVFLTSLQLEPRVAVEFVAGHQETHKHLERLSLDVCVYTCAFIFSKGSSLLLEVHRAQCLLRTLARIMGSLQSHAKSQPSLRIKKAMGKQGSLLKKAKICDCLISTKSEDDIDMQEEQKAHRNTFLCDKDGQCCQDWEV